jgi:hypothetical protein
MQKRWTASGFSPEGGSTTKAMRPGPLRPGILPGNSEADAANEIRTPAMVNDIR